MSETIIIALLGIAGTLLSPLVSQLADNNRAKNERKLHAQKASFDLEFNLYQTLVEKHLTMVYDIGAAVILSRGGSYPGGKTNKEFISLVAQHIDDAENQNKKSAPFISKEIFEAYKKLGKLSYNAISMFSLYCSFDETGYSEIKFKDKLYSKNEAQKELEAMQKEVSALSDKVLDQVRDYINKSSGK